MEVWIRGCLALRMRGLHMRGTVAGLLIYGCVDCCVSEDVWMCGRVGVLLCGYVDMSEVWMCGYV